MEIEDQTTTDDSVQILDAPPSSSSQPKGDLLEWSAADVIHFLHSIGLAQYDASFTANHVDGRTLCSLTSQELAHDLGVASLGHRKQILHYIEQKRGFPSSLATLCVAQEQQYAMTACISAAVSSILNAHCKPTLQRMLANTSPYKTGPTHAQPQQPNEPIVIDDDDDDDAKAPQNTRTLSNAVHQNTPSMHAEHQQRMIRASVAMATEAVKHIIQNQDRILNTLRGRNDVHTAAAATSSSTRKTPSIPTTEAHLATLHSLTQRYSRCRKQAPLQMATQPRTKPHRLNSEPSHCNKKSAAKPRTSSRNSRNRNKNKSNKQSSSQKATASERRRSNLSWSHWDERELLKLKSLSTLTWARIGEYLQRTGAACQLHWKSMKNGSTIPLHIEHIKDECAARATDAGSELVRTEPGVDSALIASLGRVLQHHQWSPAMLDVLWENMVKESERARELLKYKEISVATSTDESPQQQSTSNGGVKLEPNGIADTSATTIKSEHNSSSNNASVRVVDRSKSKWSVQDEEVLIHMLSQSDCSMEAIAQKLGRSVNAINKHRMAMRQKSQKNKNGHQEQAEGESEHDSDDEHESSVSASEDSDDQNEEQHTATMAASSTHVVLAPIITPDSYVVDHGTAGPVAAAIADGQQVQLPQQMQMAVPPQFATTAPVYYSPPNLAQQDAANMSSATTNTTTTSASSTSLEQSAAHTAHANPFKCMPVFNVTPTPERTLSPHHYAVQFNPYSPPHKKQKTSATTARCSEYLPLPNIVANANHGNIMNINNHLRSNENIALPSLNTSFQSNELT